MVKKIIFLMLLSVMAFSACEGSRSSSAHDDDCEENAANCQVEDIGGDGAAAQ